MTFNAVLLYTKVEKLLICNAGKINVCALPKTLIKFPEQMILFTIFRTALSHGWTNADIGILRINIPFFFERFEE